jgi:hypothetical protein
MELTGEYQYKNTSLLNDRRNNRKQGQHCPRHIKTVDRRGGCTCKFQLMDKWDLHCFYIDLQQKAGNLYHTSPIPVFSHMRSVSVDDNGTMFCTCKYKKTRLAMCPSSKCSNLLSSILKDLEDLLIMTYQSVGGATTCITPTNQVLHCI